jgi:hypothetical protein
MDIACSLCRKHGQVDGGYGASVLVALGAARKQNSNSLAREGQVLPDSGSV